MQTAFTYSTDSQRTAYRNGPTPGVCFPQLPEQVAGRFVKGQMFAHQDSLPKLPVPPLQQTLKKFLRGVEYLVSSEELEKTKKVVAEFGKPGGVGEQLQKKLLERAEAKENWLADWWEEMAYWSKRNSLVVHSNVSAGGPPSPCGDRETYAKSVARLLLNAAKWSLLAANHAIPPERQGRSFLCMTQSEVHSKCRVPGASMDTIRKTPLRDSRHIIIARNGNFYKLDVLYECPDGTLALAPPNHIVEQLLAILQTSPETCEHPVGILTSEHRDTWYRARQELLLDSINKSSLDNIESSIALVSMDKPQVQEDDDTLAAFRNVKYWDEEKTILCNKSLHGSGCQQESHNRWFDLCAQYFIGEDGKTGGHLEHSVSDGVAAISVLSFSLLLSKMCDVLLESSPVPESCLRPFQPLHWNISEKLAGIIEKAKENADQLIANLDMHVFSFNEFGKNFPKSLKLSPDGFVQNAILLAYYRIHHNIPCMCESGSTRMFKFARTDFIRNTTSEACAFVKAMQDHNTSSSVKAKALLAAIEAHSQAAVEAIEGQAFDRHLLGLRRMAMEVGLDTPDIFNDTSYKKTTHITMLCSQVPVPNLFLCFGSRAPDGYGICYNPQEKHIIITASSFHSCPDTNTVLLLQGMCEAMSEMRDILLDSDLLKDPTI